MAKSKVYEQHKVADAVPVTVTITDAKFRVGDRVRWKGRRAIAIHGNSAGEIVGNVRAIKTQGNLTYAVIAADPYGQIFTPPVTALEKLDGGTQ